jgi:hypothetical protein
MSVRRLMRRVATGVRLALIDSAEANASVYYHPEWAITYLATGFDFTTFVMTHRTGQWLTELARVERMHSTDWLCSECGLGSYQPGSHYCRCDVRR